MARRIPAEVQAALFAFRERLVRRFGDRLRELKLFGSYARGTAWEESDVDVLVLIDAVTRQEKDEIVALATDAGEGETGWLVISPFVRAPEAFAELRRGERRIALDIDREGIAL